MITLLPSCAPQAWAQGCTATLTRRGTRKACSVTLQSPRGPGRAGRGPPRRAGGGARWGRGSSGAGPRGLPRLFPHRPGFLAREGAGWLREERGSRRPTAAEVCTRRAARPSYDADWACARTASSHPLLVTSAPVAVHGRRARRATGSGGQSPSLKRAAAQA